MTNPPKKRGRKSNAEKAALAAVVHTPDPAEFHSIAADGVPIYVEAERAQLTDHELTGLFAEAFEAYDMQGELTRFDSLGRKWTFRPAVLDGKTSVLELMCWGPNFTARTIDTQTLGCDLGKPEIERVIREMDAA